MHGKNLTSHQLAQQVLDTEAQVLAIQREILLLSLSVSALQCLTKEDLLVLLRMIRADFQRGKYSPLVYKLLQAMIADWIRMLRRLE